MASELGRLTGRVAVQVLINRTEDRRMMKQAAVPNLFLLEQEPFLRANSLSLSSMAPFLNLATHKMQNLLAPPIQKMATKVTQGCCVQSDYSYPDDTYGGDSRTTVLLVFTSPCTASAPPTAWRIYYTCLHT